MFVAEFGKSVDASAMKGTTLVIPSQSIGMSPFLGMDLFILNKGMERIGFYKSDYVSPVIVNDLLTLGA